MTVAGQCSFFRFVGPAVTAMLVAFKNFAANLDEIARCDAAGKLIEIWFQDEAILLYDREIVVPQATIQAGRSASRSAMTWQGVAQLTVTHKPAGWQQHWVRKAKPMA